MDPTTSEQQLTLRTIIHKLVDMLASDVDEDTLVYVEQREGRIALALDVECFAHPHGGARSIVVREGPPHTSS